MNWGSVERDFVGWASKRLTPHEIDPSVSNGHEFQGVNKLTSLLGQTERRHIPAVYCLMADRGNEPGWAKVLQSTASWYDSRKANPSRTAEWRLYYPDDAGFVQSLCKAGDLMMIALRHDGSLTIILAGAGSASEAFLTHIFHLDGQAIPATTCFRYSPASAAGALGLSGADAVGQLNLDFDDAPDSNPLFTQSVTSNPAELTSGDREVARIAEEMTERWPEGKLGDSATICDLVIQICSADPLGEPDGSLIRWLEAAEAAYWLWESEMMGRFLRPVRFDEEISDRDLGDKISERWMSYRQSRVSRAGAVMEEFLARIFKGAGLRFEHGRTAKIEGGKLPDFLFPGTKAYNDPKWPSDNLRILGSKTSFKDRWRQILAEGNRVTKKHGVTRDLAITSSLFAQMDTAGLIVVMPQSVLTCYSSPPPNLISLSQFIAEVRGIQKMQTT